jgi:hypothetical protein
MRGMARRWDGGGGDVKRAGGGDAAESRRRPIEIKYLYFD